ncbi:MAG: xanthine dehydrogenase family protein subunit M [Acidimicrobiia bacterium]|nr:xanthine dehydrogenase family protein subunit M [Acidimicrobiia bacterium]MYC57860.1 xanthine dehydrogenase family protein subunit M [Acidimicrobiia bacterium]MYG94761.1 xanthine dehydrogenase family protein subunit M [Acidimicrobiia bacterium]MYI30229.1 xanthine dehydrogenase family protein subunit M [Acidimicrobiia bacterium]
MIPTAFDYIRARSIEEALAALATHGDEAKLLAGGHSLLPLMKLRLATPAVLVDIGRLDDLRYINDVGDYVAIGALTRHRSVETSDLVRSQAGLLAEATSYVGDPQVRHMGTIGGSVVHGDPASDLPSALLAMRATLVVQGPSGQREIAVDDFFTGFLDVSLGVDELLIEIRVPKMPDARWSFQKFNRRAQDWAIVGVSVVVNNGSSGIGLVNMDSVPLRAVAVEAAVNGGASASEAAQVAAEGANPPSDLNAGPEYREHLARVLTRRALAVVGC